MTDQTPQEQPPKMVTIAHPAFPDRVRQQIPVENLEAWKQSGWLHVTDDDAAEAPAAEQPQPTTVEAPAAATDAATATGTGTSVPDASGPTAPATTPTA